MLHTLSGPKIGHSGRILNPNFCNLADESGPYSETYSMRSYWQRTTREPKIIGFSVRVIWPSNPASCFVPPAHSCLLLLSPPCETRPNCATGQFASAKSVVGRQTPAHVYSHHQAIHRPYWQGLMDSMRSGRLYIYIYVYNPTLLWDACPHAVCKSSLCWPA